MNARTTQPFRRVLPVVAGAVALLALGACNKGTTTAGGTPTPTGTVTSAPASAGPTASATPTTPPQPDVPACAATDLVARPTETDGAMGRVGFTVTVANHGRQACSLTGPPVVWYTDAHGGPHKLPETIDDGSRARVVVPAGATASFDILITDGYGGYDPGSPACAHPYTYRGTSVQAAGGRVSVPDLSLHVQCGGIGVGGWRRS